MYIGIDLGGTNIAAALLDGDCNIVSKLSIPTNADRKDREIVHDMASLSIRLTEEAGYKKEDVEWVGIGSPGTVDNANGILIYANNIPFRRTPMREYFQEIWDLPVYLGNDADCAALGEAYAGVAKDCDCALMITLGTGVGGGIIINKRIYTGFNNAGAEIGHMVIEHGGLPCTCGRLGCFEAYASATGLIHITDGIMDKYPDSIMLKLTNNKEHISGRTAFEALKAGDEGGKAAVDIYVSYLACGIASLINIFSPEIFVLGGGISKEGQLLLDLVNEKLTGQIYAKDVPQTVLKTATLGNDAGIIGAAMLGR